MNQKLEHKYTGWRVTMAERLLCRRMKLLLYLTIDSLLFSIKEGESSNQASSDAV